MSTCANCKTDAIYSYLMLTYCNRHLPRFLRDRQGKPNNLVSVIVAESRRSTVDYSLVPDVLEPVVEPAVVVAPVEEVLEAVEPEEVAVITEDAFDKTPKKKAAPKAD